MRFVLFFLTLYCFLPLSSVAQASLDLTVDDYGLSFGDSRRVNGLRFNFRDRHLDRVNGINVT
ncbi:MAG: hypothetical protein ACOCTG_03150, partial [Bacteroidota bacterium]